MAKKEKTTFESEIDVLVKEENTEKTSLDKALDLFEEDTEEQLEWDVPKSVMLRAVEFMKETDKKHAKLFHAQRAIIETSPEGKKVVVEWRNCKFVAPSALNTQLSKIVELSSKILIVKYAGKAISPQGSEFKSFIVKVP
jgi:hypothetical protein